VYAVVSSPASSMVMRFPKITSSEKGRPSPSRADSIGLKEIRRLLGSSGLGREAGSLADYQLAEPSSELRKSAVQTTITRKTDEPPRRKQREQPASNCRKHEFELVLNDVVTLLDGVDVVAEGDATRAKACRSSLG
jgi:hypothetical protein